MTSIEKWVNRKVFILDREDTVYQACLAMKRNGATAAIIIDPNQQPVGIFTERDVLIKVTAKDKDPQKIKIKEVMTSPIKTAKINESYQRIYKMMSAYQVRHLPLVDNTKKLAGIISMQDLMRYSVQIMEKTVLDLEKERETLYGLLEKESDQRTKQLYDENKKLQELITIDSLTGLFNHKYFRNAIEKEVCKAKRYYRPLTLLFIDIDHFKHYNDLNGHEQGNKVLVQLAEILKNTSRKVRKTFAFGTDTMDIVARYGGEEFVILMPETRYTGGKARAIRLISDVRNFNFFNKQKQPSGNLTISVGIAEFPSQAKNEDELISVADEALYKAKKNGRDQVC